jgi:hypothetical protein
MASQVASRTKIAEPAAKVEPAHEPIQTAVEESLDPVEIAVLAYRLWHERGCPSGTDQEDWFRAERELRSNRKEG